MSLTKSIWFDEDSPNLIYSPKTSIKDLQLIQVLVIDSTIKLSVY